MTAPQFNIIAIYDTARMGLCTFEWERLSRTPFKNTRNWLAVAANRPLWRKGLCLGEWGWSGRSKDSRRPQPPGMRPASLVLGIRQWEVARLWNYEHHGCLWVEVSQTLELASQRIFGGLCVHDTIRPKWGLNNLLNRKQ